MSRVASVLDISFCVEPATFSAPFLVWVQFRLEVSVVPAFSRHRVLFCAYVLADHVRRSCAEEHEVSRGIPETGSLRRSSMDRRFSVRRTQLESRSCGNGHPSLMRVIALREMEGVAHPELDKTSQKVAEG